MKFEIEITDDAFNLLKKIHQVGSAEYRDPEYLNLEEFKNSEEYKNGDRSVGWFKSRNFDGTLYLIGELSRYNLVDNDFDAWHRTYVVTDLGKELLGQKEEYLLSDENEKIKKSEEYFEVDQFGKIEKKILNDIVRRDPSFRYFKNLDSAKSFVKGNTFVSEDGEEYFYGIYMQMKQIFAVDPLFKGVDVHDGYYPGMDEHYFKFFSNRDKAEDFYLKNKPCLSFNDVLPLISDLVEEQTLINLVKEKIGK